MSRRITARNIFVFMTLGSNSQYRPFFFFGHATAQQQKTSFQSGSEQEGTREETGDREESRKQEEQRGKGRE